MCILLKLHYAKFDVSGLFCSKVIEEPPPPLPFVKEGLRLLTMEWKRKSCKIEFNSNWCGGGEDGIHPPRDFPPLCQNIWHKGTETF